MLANSKSDIAAADNKKTLRQRFEIEQGLTDIDMRRIDAGNRRNKGPGAGVDDDGIAFDDFVVPTFT
jgi:hypothetical protein